MTDLDKAFIIGIKWFFTGVFILLTFTYITHCCENQDQMYHVKNIKYDPNTGKVIEIEKYE